MPDPGTSSPLPLTSLASARARRLVPEPPAGNAVSDLAADLTLDEVSERRGLTPAAARGIRSFYDQLEHRTRVCDGTACRFAGGPALRERLEELGPVGEVRCLGHCYAAPAFRSGDKVYSCPSHTTVANWLDEWGEGPSPMVDLLPVPRASLAAEPVVLRHLLPGLARDPWREYELSSAADAEAILRIVESAPLQGRGEAGPPPAAKWRAAGETPAERRWVVANGDEGDPGCYVDRLLLEEDPHSVLAGMLTCARAIGASRGIVYIRSEYPQSLRAMRTAIVEARRHGALGPAFEVEVVAGAGSYVCGEESALLRSIEGLRGEPAPRPFPFAARSLFGEPAVVHNVETFAAVPWVMRHARASGTKAVCLAGAVQRPGVVEVPFGTPLREVLMRAGGGPASGSTWTMALVGGPTGRVLPENRFDTPLGYDSLPGMGHAGVVVLDERVSPRALALHLMAFARAESCGTCTPCRIGTARLADIGGRAALERLLTTMEMGSLCGFAAAVGRPLRDLLAHYGNEVLS